MSNSNDTKPENYHINARVCRLIEKYPCLYDRSHPHYSKKEAIDKVWIKIAKELDDTIPACKERWRNIRTSFARSINVNKIPVSANRTKPYYLHEELQFLTKHITPGIPISRRSQQNSRNSNQNVSDDCIKEEEASVSNAGFDEHHGRSDNEPDTMDEESQEVPSCNEYGGHQALSDEGLSRGDISLETAATVPHIGINKDIIERLSKTANGTENYSLQQMLMRELHLRPKSSATVQQPPPPLTPCPSAARSNQKRRLQPPPPPHQPNPLFYRHQSGEEIITAPSSVNTTIINGNVISDVPSSDDGLQPPTKRPNVSQGLNVIQTPDYEGYSECQTNSERLALSKSVDFDFLFVQSLLPEMRAMTLQQKIRFKQGIYKLLHELFQCGDTSASVPLSYAANIDPNNHILHHQSPYSANKLDPSVASAPTNTLPANSEVDPRFYLNNVFSKMMQIMSQPDILDVPAAPPVAVPNATPVPQNTTVPYVNGNDDESSALKTTLDVGTVTRSRAQVPKNTKMLSVKKSAGVSVNTSSTSPSKTSVQDASGTTSSGSPQKQNHSTNSNNSQDNQTV